MGDESAGGVKEDMLLFVIHDIVCFEEKNFGTKRGQTVARRPLLTIAKSQLLSRLLVLRLRNQQRGSCSKKQPLLVAQMQHAEMKLG